MINRWNLMGYFGGKLRRSWTGGVKFKARTFPLGSNMTEKDPAALLKAR